MGTAGQQSPAVVLRPAARGDFAFAAQIYLEAMGPTLARLPGLDSAGQMHLLRALWDPAEVRVIVAMGREVGWVQLAPAPGGIFIRNFVVARAYQRLGIGNTVLALILADAGSRATVTLGVVKGSRAQRLYERQGFKPTHCDDYHVYMRREPTETQPLVSPSPVRSPRSRHR